MSKVERERSQLGALLGCGFVVWSALGAFGCAVEAGSAEELATVGQALNGDATFENCSAAGRVQLTAALELARDALDSPKMARCLSNHALSGALGRSAEYIVNQMKADMSTHINCTVSSSSTPIDSDDESIILEDTFNKTTEWLAGAILHEVAHNKGYQHPSIGRNSAEYEYTVPEQLAYCAQSILEEDFYDDIGLGEVPKAYGGHVAGLRPSSMTGLAGDEAATPYEDVCPLGAFAGGIVGTSDDTGINSLGVVCKDDDGDDTIEVLPSRGNGEGTSFGGHCPSDQLLIGLTGKADGNVEQVRAVCVSAEDLHDAVAGSKSYGTRYGQDRGFSTTRLCPTGEAVKGIKTYAGDAGVYGYMLYCEDVDKRNVQASQDWDRVGRKVGEERLDRCPRSTVMTEIFGRSSNELDRIGGVCEKVTDRGTYVDLTGDAAGVVPGRGGPTNGEAWGSERCPSGEALVGLELRANERVKRVRGLCADVSDWSGSAETPNITYKPWHGGDSGDSFRRLCSRGYFLSGWRSWVDKQNGTSTVFGLDPICIEPEE